MCSLVSPLASRTSRSSSGWKYTACPRSRPAGRGWERGSRSLGQAAEPAVPPGSNRLPGFSEGFAAISKPSTPQRLWCSHPAGCSAACWASVGAGSALRHLPQCGRAVVLGALPAARLLAKTPPAPVWSPTGHGWRLGVPRPSRNPCRGCVCGSHWWVVCLEPGSVLAAGAVVTS